VWCGVLYDVCGVLYGVCCVVVWCGVLYDVCGVLYGVCCVVCCGVWCGVLCCVVWCVVVCSVMCVVCPHTRNYRQAGTLKENVRYIFHRSVKLLDPVRTATFSLVAYYFCISP